MRSLKVKHTMSRITAELTNEEPIVLDRNARASVVVLRFSFGEETLTYSRPVTVDAVLLTMRSGEEAGFVGTPRLRRLEGGERFDSTHPLLHSVDPPHEMRKSEPEDLAELPSGEALLELEGTVWVQKRPQEFHVRANVRIV